MSVIKDKRKQIESQCITQAYLWNEGDVYSCVWFDEFNKYLSSNVPQELCNTAPHESLQRCVQHMCFAYGLKSCSPLTLYVLSNERVIHYVTVICFQDFLKFSDVIVLVGAGRKNSQCCYSAYIVFLWPPQKPSTTQLSNMFLNTRPFVNTILIADVGVCSELLVYSVWILNKRMQPAQFETAPVLVILMHRSNKEAEDRNFSTSILSIVELM